MKKLFLDNRGVVIVEATIIFPIVFIVVFMMVFLGNAYFQKSRVESVIAQETFYGAALCADPLLTQINENGASELTSDYEIVPYRYLSGGMDDIVQIVENNVYSRVNKISPGFYSGMKPKLEKVEAKFNNAFVYSTFSVEAKCKIPFPIKIPGMKNALDIDVSCRYDVPVADVPEFIRNINMVEDWLETSEQASKITGKIEEIMGKVSGWIN